MSVITFRDAHIIICSMPGHSVENNFPKVLLVTVIKFFQMLLNYLK